MRAKFIDVAGTQTRVLSEGEDNPDVLLLIHGFGSSADTWMHNIDVLGRNFHVIVPDLVGHGFTGSVDLEDGPSHPEAVNICSVCLMSWGSIASFPVAHPMADWSVR